MRALFLESAQEAWGGKIRLQSVRSPSGDSGNLFTPGGTTNGVAGPRLFPGRGMGGKNGAGVQSAVTRKVKGITVSGERGEKEAYAIGCSKNQGQEDGSAREERAEKVGGPAAREDICKARKGT